MWNKWQFFKTSLYTQPIPIQLLIKSLSQVFCPAPFTQFHPRCIFKSESGDIVCKKSLWYWTFVCMWMDKCLQSEQVVSPGLPGRPTLSPSTPVRDILTPLTRVRHSYNYHMMVEIGNFLSWKYCSPFRSIINYDCMKVIGIAPRPSLLLQARLLGSQIWASSSYPLFWTTVAREQRWLFNPRPIKMQSIQEETASQVIIIIDDIFLETPSHPRACSLLAHKVHTLRAPEPSLRVRVVEIN